MTEDEKLAEEWLDERYLKDMGIRKPCKEAFLAGLKAGREIEKEYVRDNAFTSMKEQGLFPFGKWHKVTGGDLPKNNTAVLVILKNKRMKISTFMENKFTIWNNDYDAYTKLYDVIAWCEVLKFEE